MQKSMKRVAVLFLVIAAMVATHSFLPRQKRKSKEYGPVSPIPTQTQFKEIRRLAEAGDAVSQMYMGVFYANGHHVEHDYVKAAEWYRKAAEQGNPKAQRYLGLLYDCGIGVKQDRREAFDWFMKAVKQNDPAANFEIGSYPLFHRESVMDSSYGIFNAWRMRAFYLMGLRCEYPDYETGFWKQYYAADPFFQNDSALARAIYEYAEDGDSDAQLYMVKMHMYAQGIPFDKNEIEIWLAKAVEKNNPYALFLLGSAEDDTYFSLPSDDARKRYLQQAADADVEYCFNYMYWSKYGQDENDKYTAEALLELNELADRGYKYAQLRMGNHYDFQNDYDRAIDLMRRSSEQGVVAADSKLMTYYFSGLGTTVNYEEGIRHLKKVLHYPDSYHLFMLDSYFNSLHSEVFSNVWKLMEERASSGDVDSMLALAIMANTEKMNYNHGIMLNYLSSASLKESPVALYLMSKFLRFHPTLKDATQERIVKLAALGHVEPEMAKSLIQISNNVESYLSDHNISYTKTWPFFLACRFVSACQDYIPAMTEIYLFMEPDSMKIQDVNPFRAALANFESENRVIMDGDIPLAFSGYLDFKMICTGFKNTKVYIYLGTYLTY